MEQFQRESFTQEAYLEQKHSRQERPRLKKGTVLLFVLVIVMLLCGKAFALYFCDTSLPEPYRAPPAYPGPKIDSAVSNDLLIRNIPITIYFPAYRIQSGIYPVGLTAEGAIETMDTPFAAAWYMDFAAPGEQGNCIINGHDYWKERNGCFAVLKRMQLGDEVVIKMEDGSYAYYRAVSVDAYPIDDFPPETLQNNGNDRLTLITCHGGYDSILDTSPERVIVVCEQRQE